MKILDFSTSERPRERLIASGPSALSDGELIAVLLRSGTQSSNILDISRQLLAECGGSLTALSRMSVDQLCNTPGIGEGKAAVLLAAFELGRRFFLEDNAALKKAIRNSGMVYNLMSSRLRGLDHEECWAVFLNATYKVLSLELMGSGTEDSVLVDAKDVVKKALEKGARAVILCHNHPGGNPMPSKADIEKTVILHKSCDACDLQLLDHIIISDRCWYSFSEEKVSHE